MLDPKTRTGWRALVLRLLPWYDTAAERERDAQSEALHRRAIRARIAMERIREEARLEDVRKAYIAAGERLRR